jgi:23S rRNA (cytidine1920-2'-O)/16S rRNA (cytidine1409-2'-O)-methyltransferase
MAKRCLDTLLVEQGLVESRERAQSLILAGKVKVDGQVADKPGEKVPSEVEITLEEALPYVSRGGLKLEEALSRFQLDVSGLICADVGASTGGFTDCLLQHGAAKVYAIDVGYGQLAWELRQDPRVVVLERTNIRYLASLAEPIDLATIDVSFISLELVLPPVLNFLKPEGQIIALVKPQFEARREQVGKGGVVKDPEVHRQVLHKVAKVAQGLGLRVFGLIPSPLLGPAGNVEFFIYLARGEEAAGADLEEAVTECLELAATKAESR